MSISEYRNWTLKTDEQNILWLEFDRENQAVNSFSQDVMQELDTILDSVHQLNPKGVVITSAKKTGYIAGADITQFSTLSTEEEAFSLIRQGQLVFNKLEQLPMPTVALINGFCLGGGYEMALACRYRVALNEPKVKIGLPEVKLGLQPGWGGTVRLPKLIGPVNAMDIMLNGKAVSPRSAKRLGMVDTIVPERQLKRAACYYIENKPTKQSMGFKDQCMSLSFIRPLIAKICYQKLASKNILESHYPAPFAIIERWVKDFGQPCAMENEARSIAQLMVTSTARNLLRVFFLQNTMKELAQGSVFRAKHVHVIGAGTMGGDIAAWCALRGLHVTLQDQTPERIAPAIKRAYRLFSKKLKKPRLIQQAMDRLQSDVKGTGVRGADVIIEAIFEDLSVKQELFQHIEKEARAEAILATNTSSIPLEDIADVLTNPERLIGIHFFNPVSKMPLVEVVQSKLNDQQLVKSAAAFVKQISRSPLVVRSSPGFLVNRLLMPYLNEAMKLFEEGVPKETIDQVALDFGMPMGPIVLADTVGLDICLSVATNLCEHFGGAVSPRLQEMVNQGKLGLKSGEGFYRYDGKGKPIKAKSTPAAEQKRQDVVNRLILVMLNEAVACLSEEVVASKDLLDAGMIFGAGFAPFRGGPMQYAKDRGFSEIITKLHELAAQHGERFKPHEGWDHFVAVDSPSVSVVNDDKVSVTSEV
jgi:3-hydroxyacyl-CoA dehydrogenase / enoyl-CoA hydratase / 3-hydroxybutyryl-CoA epimerase